MYCQTDASSRVQFASDSTRKQFPNINPAPSLVQLPSERCKSLNTFVGRHLLWWSEVRSALRVKPFCFLPSAHITLVRATSRDKHHRQRKLLPKLLAWVYARRRVCHTGTKIHTCLWRIQFSWGKGQTPTASQLLRGLSLFPRSDLAVTGEPRTPRGLHNAHRAQQGHYPTSVLL